MSIIILCSFIVHVCRVCSRSGRSGRSRVWYGRWNRTWTVYFYFYYFDYIILDYNENTMYNMPQRSRPLTNTAVSIFFLKSLTGRTRGGGGGVWRRVGGRRDGTSWIYDEFRAVRSSCSRPLSRLRWRQRMMGGPVSRAVANDCYYHYYTICTQSTNRGAVTILNTRESLRRLRARVPRGGSRRFVFTFPTLWPSCTTRTAHSRCCCHRAPLSVVVSRFARCCCFCCCRCRPVFWSKNRSAADSRGSPPSSSSSVWTRCTDGKQICSANLVSSK